MRFFERKKLWIAPLIAAALLMPVDSQARTTAEIVAGRVVSSPEQTGTLWFVHPKLLTRQQITTWQSVLDIAAKSGTTISVAGFDRIDSGTDTSVFDTKLAKRMRGRMLLDVSTGERWYVSTSDFRRYSVASAEDAYEIFDLVKLGISAKNLNRIPTALEDSTSSMKLRQRLRGRILWHVESNTRWYVSPKDFKRYPVESLTDVEALLDSQLQGITSAKLAQIPRGEDSLQPNSRTTRAYSGRFVRPAFDPDQLWYVSPRTSTRVHVTPENFAQVFAAEQTLITLNGLGEIRLTGEADYVETTVSTSQGSFVTKVLTADLSLPGMVIVTLGGNDDTCLDDCLTQSVGAFAARYKNGIAALNGTYFCPATASSCANQSDSYFSPLYHSGVRTMVNQEEVATSAYAMLVWDTAGRPYYFHPASQFGSPEQFEAAHGVTIQAAIANWPALIEGGVDVSRDQLLDSGQKSTKTTRVAVGVKGTTVYFFVVSSATVSDLAAVVATYGVDYAINLDGGSSSALWQYGSYRVGPGRPVPNAIVVRQDPSG
ncbi:MAG: phosphodiester glycosidase family protein [Candidatus Kerfeldbacteria bacterium]|nr:phosphodiester glycosidase family protein [Candidatus Kerfeldbacteria bacterium]